MTSISWVKHLICIQIGVKETPLVWQPDLLKLRVLFMKVSQALNIALINLNSLCELMVALCGAFPSALVQKDLQPQQCCCRGAGWAASPRSQMRLTASAGPALPSRSALCASGRSGWKWKGWKLFFSWSSSRSEFEFLLTSFSEFLHWNNLIIAYIFKRHYSFRHPEQMSRQISCSVSETFKPTDAFCCSEGLIFPPL